MRHNLGIRGLVAGLALIAASLPAIAQIEGPVPLAWRFVQPTRTSPGGIPLVQNDRIYIAVGQRVFSLDRNTGNLRWRFPSDEGIDGQFVSAPILAGDTIVAASDNRQIFGINPENGARKWIYQSPSPVLGQISASGEFVAFAMSDNTLMVIRASDGAAAWPAPLRVTDGVVGSIATHGGNVIALNGRNEIFAIAIGSQRTIWRQQFTQLDPTAAPVVFGDQIYINSGSNVVSLNAANGAARFQTDLREQLLFSPAVSAEGILAVTREGNIFLLDPRGRVTNRNKPIELGSLPIVRPTAVGRFFAVPATNGSLNLYAPNGDLAWSYTIRPLTTSAPTSQPGGGMMGGPGGGGMMGGPGGGGGMMGGGGGGMMGGPGGGGMGGGAAQQQAQQPTSIQPAGPAILDGRTLLILARDGSLLAFDPDNGVDLTAPLVRMLWPTAGEQVNGGPPLAFIFRIDDEATGVNQSSLKIQIDGQDLDFEYGRDGIATVRISAMSERNKPLQDGRRTLTVTVRDWAGNERKAEFSIVIDNLLRPIQPPGQNRNNPPGRGGGGGNDGG